MFEALSPEYLERGIHFDAESDCLLIDLNEPRTIRVCGINPKTGESKSYLLKVTQSGKLLLL